MFSSFDILCIGNAKIDIFLSIPDKSPYVHLDKEVNNLCVTYGQKIPVENCSLMLGGNACNVAVGLSRLEIKTAIMAEVGNDDFSFKIINSLKSEKVNSDFLLQNPNSPSSFSVILSFQKDRTIFGQHFLREHNFSFDRISAKWIYLTSLGEKWEEPYRKTLGLVKQKRAKLAFNPGTLQLEKGYEGIKDILKATDILFVNKEEAITISNIKYQISNKELLSSLKNLGPKIVVVTDGENGSYSIDERGNFTTHGIVKAEVLEKTGAGDAYASGFLGAIILGLPIQDAMSWGAKNSAATIQKLGAQNGLLKKEEIEK